MNPIIKLSSFIAALTLLVHVSFLKIGLGNLYYGILILIFAILLVSGKNIKFNYLMLWVALAGLLSILVNDIPSFFQPYERFIAFLLVLGLLGPLITSTSLQNFRYNLFKILKSLIVVMVIISFFGIVAGLPIMQGRGIFTGLFNHSMMLGPMAAISMLVCINWFHEEKQKKRRYFYIILSLISFLACVIAGSRAALIAGVAGGLFLYFKAYQGNLSRYVRFIILAIGLGILSFPLWSSYTETIISKTEYSETQGGLTSSRDFLWTFRILEFKKSPTFGVGFASVDTSVTSRYNKETGGIEPGSSWLAVLSMLGIFGFIPFILLVFRYLVFFYQDKILVKDSAIIGALLIFFILHMIAEGYIFSAGSGLFFMFWLVMGLSEYYRQLSDKI